MTVTFNGVVLPRGAQTHTFASQASGEVRATLEAIGAQCDAVREAEAAEPADSAG